MGRLNLVRQSCLINGVGMQDEVKMRYMNDNLWDDAISKLADKLIKKPDEFSSEQIYPCPVCQKRLKIQIGRYQRSNTKMIGITVECDQCDKCGGIHFPHFIPHIHYIYHINHIL